MRRLNLGRSFATIGLTSFLATAIVGCHDGHDEHSCKDIPCGAIPQPNGAFACEWANAERCRAEQDGYVIYDYEWSADPTKLTANGEEHAIRIAHTLAQTPYPVIIEQSADRRTDELRRGTVLAALVNAGCPTDPARVICGRPEAEGLYGQEATRVAGGMLSNQGATGGGAGLGTSIGASQGGGGSSGGVGGSSGVGSGGGMGAY